VHVRELENPLGKCKRERERERERELLEREKQPSPLCGLVETVATWSPRQQQFHQKPLPLFRTIIHPHRCIVSLLWFHYTSFSQCLCSSWMVIFFGKFFNFGGKKFFFSFLMEVCINDLVVLSPLFCAFVVAINVVCCCGVLHLWGFGIFEENTFWDFRIWVLVCCCFDFKFVVI